MFNGIQMYSNNTDLFSDAKRQHGDFMRIQQQNSLSLGGAAAGVRKSFELKGADLASNNSKNYSRENPKQNQAYGDFLRQQIDDKKNNRQPALSLDSKAAKIKALQDKMSSHSEDPFGRGGSGAPLHGKNSRANQNKQSDIFNYESLPQQPKNNLRLDFEIPKISQFPQSYHKENISNQWSLQADSKYSLNRPQQTSITPKPPADSQLDNSVQFRRQNRGLLAQENQNSDDLMKKAHQKSSIQQALLEQMEEKERKKREEKQREKEEDMRMEERIRLDRIQMEKDMLAEQESKKRKVLQVSQQNHLTTVTAAAAAAAEKKNKLHHHHSSSNTNANNTKPTLSSVPSLISQISQTLPQQPQYQNNNNNNIYSIQHKQSVSLTPTLAPLKIAPLKQLSQDWYSNYPSTTSPAVQGSIFTLNQQNSSSSVNSHPNGNTYSQADIYPKRLSQLEQRQSLTSEPRRRDIIPEIEGMKLQIQEQYKRLSVDVKQIKIENFQAIDDRNKAVPRSNMNLNLNLNVNPLTSIVPHTKTRSLTAVSAGSTTSTSFSSQQQQQQQPSYSIFAANPQNPIPLASSPAFQPFSLPAFNQNQKGGVPALSSNSNNNTTGTAAANNNYMFTPIRIPQQAQTPSVATALTTGQQIVVPLNLNKNQNLTTGTFPTTSTIGAAGASMPSHQTQEKTQVTLTDEEANTIMMTLQAESKMIPMSIIDHLRKKDLLTMSSLMNYDQFLSLTKGDPRILNTLSNSNTPIKTVNSATTPWDIPTVNTDLSKDIDQILIKQNNHMAQNQQKSQQEKQQQKQPHKIVHSPVKNKSSPIISQKENNSLIHETHQSNAMNVSTKNNLSQSSNHFNNRTEDDNQSTSNQVNNYNSTNNKNSSYVSQNQNQNQNQNNNNNNNNNNSAIINNNSSINQSNGKSGSQVRTPRQDVFAKAETTMFNKISMDQIEKRNQTSRFQDSRQLEQQQEYEQLQQQQKELQQQLLIQQQQEQLEKQQQSSVQQHRSQKHHHHHHHHNHNSHSDDSNYYYESQNLPNHTNQTQYYHDGPSITEQQEEEEDDEYDNYRRYDYRLDSQLQLHQDSYQPTGISERGGDDTRTVENNQDEPSNRSEFINNNNNTNNNNNNYLKNNNNHIDEQDEISNNHTSNSSPQISSRSISNQMKPLISQKNSCRKSCDQFVQQYDFDTDCDELKKQKVLREIKDKFNLSTVHEEMNERTRQFSTLLETGRYADNKELYESLRAVEDPDFSKLDDLIRRFKKDRLPNQQPLPSENANHRYRNTKTH